MPGPRPSKAAKGCGAAALGVLLLVRLERLVPQLRLLLLLLLLLHAQGLLPWHAEPRRLAAILRCLGAG